jgi:hypothetical protein
LRFTAVLHHITDWSGRCSSIVALEKPNACFDKV